MEYDNLYIAAKLKLIGKLLEIQGENPFKTRAYSKGADVLKKLPEDLDKIISQSRLHTLDGIGPALREKILALHETGTCPTLDRLESEIPEGVREMLQIKGIGPSKIRVIWLKMNISTLGELYYACMENRLIEEKGFGEKTQDLIRRAIEFLQSQADKFHYARVHPIAEEVLTAFRKVLGEDARIEAAGDFGRKMPVLDGADLYADPGLRTSLHETANNLKNFLLKENDEGFELTRLDTSIPVRVHFPESDFYPRLIRATASESFLEAAGLPAEGEFSSEAACFEAAGVAFVPAEYRESRAAAEAACAGEVPALIEMPDIRGMLHCHSTWSDGAHTLKQMAEHCRKNGWTYMGITDHSKSAFYANGLSEGRVEAQWAEIDALNAAMDDFRIFKGIESDILSDGSLDYAGEVLAGFDFVIASVHSVLNMDKDRATERLIKAVENPYTRILGHPTGRLLLVREGYPIDHKKVIDACAANGVAIEINANPHRLDLDWEWVPYALKQGVWIAINPDAHRIDGFADTYWGLQVARKGGLTAGRCLNHLDPDQLAEFFARKGVFA